MSMRTYTLFIGCLNDARRVTAELLNASQWFAIEPWPLDVYAVTVKVENQDMLRSIAGRACSQ